MFVLALQMDVHINGSRSLKAKRQVIKSVLETAQYRFRVSVAEIGDQDLWQRAQIGFAIVASSQHHAEEVIDAVERLVWSYPELAVSSTERRWLE
jgi:uncharacterized protein